MGERLGLLHRREVAAFRHHAPAPNVREDALGHRAGRSQDFARKLGITHRRGDGGAVRDGPGAVHPGVIGPERRADGAGEPVEGDVRQQLVLGEDRIDVAAAIGPSTKLLGDPGGEPGRRVGESKGQRLRPRALDPLIAGLLLEPAGEGIE